MGQNEEIPKIADLFNKKYHLCILLKDIMLSLRDAVKDGDTQRIGINIRKRDGQIRNINALDDEISRHKEKEHYLTKKRASKLREILKELTDIQKECLGDAESQVRELRTNVSSMRRNVQAFRNYTPRPVTHSRFVDTVR